MASPRRETDDTAHLDPSTARVTSTVPHDNLFKADSSNEPYGLTSSLERGNTSNFAFVETVPGKPEGRSNPTRCGGLSLAFADFTARSKLPCTISGSHLPPLSSIVKEEVLAPGTSSKESANLIALPVSTLSKENSGYFVYRCFFCNQKRYEIRNDSVKVEDCGSERGCTNDLDERAQMNAGLEVAVRLINGDSTSQPPRPVPADKETDENTNKHMEHSQGLFSCSQCSKIRGSEDLSLYERRFRKAPTEFYSIRWNSEFREHSHVKFIEKPKGRRSKHFSGNSLQQLTPMLDVTEPNSHHADSGCVQSEYISYAYSMMEGEGRTLKGRDQIRFRNHVLRSTGFLAD